MYRLKDLIVVFLCGGLLFGAGVWVGQSNAPVTVHAQAPDPGNRYQVFHNPYAQDSWYALKLDLQTGDTWIFDAEDGGADDKWKLRPVEDER
jgi:hypothetical protein